MRQEKTSEAPSISGTEKTAKERVVLALSPEIEHPKKSPARLNRTKNSAVSQPRVPFDGRATFKLCSIRSAQNELCSAQKSLKRAERSLESSERIERKSLLDNRRDDHFVLDFRVFEVVLEILTR